MDQLQSIFVAHAACQGPTQGPDVGEEAVVAATCQHLRRNVVRGATRGPQQAIIALAVRQRPQAKVRQLCIALGIQQHILQLYVSASEKSCIIPCMASA